MAFSYPVRVDVLRPIAEASISATYAAFGGPFTHRMRLVKVTNNTDGDMFIAFNSLIVAPASDGTADNDFVPAMSFVLYDFTSNSEGGGQPFCFQIGTQPWIRYSSAPTKGSVYLTSVYGKGE